MKKQINSFGWLALALACGLWSTGCKSLSGPASASFASVTIKDRTAAQIFDAAVAVFREDGYRASAVGETLVLEKEGTRLNTISRDGLVAAQAGARTLIRVRAQLVDLGGGAQRFQCQAFMVSSAGDSFFENEHPLANARSRPYQKLLNKVAKRLK